MLEPGLSAFSVVKTHVFNALVSFKNLPPFAYLVAYFRELDVNEAAAFASLIYTIILIVSKLQEKFSKRKEGKNDAT